MPQARHILLTTAALVAIGAAALWQRRRSLHAQLLAAATVAVSGGWSYVLLDRTPTWQPWLRAVVLVATVLAVAALLVGPRLGPLARRAGIVALAATAIAGLGGPVAYAVATVTTAHSGSLPSAGPAVSGVAGGLRGGPGGAGRAGSGTGAQQLFGTAPPSGRGAGTPPSGSGGAGTSALPGASGRAPGPSSFAGPGGASFAGRGGAGGALSTSAALVRALESHAGSYRWVAATAGSTNAAAYELATGGDAVMAIGGFNNNGGELSLAQFIRYVKAGDIHYFIASGGGGPGGASSSSTQVTAWVSSHYSAETIGGVTVYDLTR